jgi:hypothetical protein
MIFCFVKFYTETLYYIKIRFWGGGFINYLGASFFQNIHLGVGSMTLSYDRRFQTYLYALIMS